MTITKVWSGGQDGSDIAGLRAAKRAGIKTGGWMPKGWRTISGARPEYAELYGMQEHRFADYPGRTEANVRDTDGTLLVGDNPDSVGSVQTLKFARLLNKPMLVVRVEDFPGMLSRDMAQWISRSRIHRLNIAGNRFAPEHVVEDWLFNVFKYVNDGMERKIL